MGPKQRPGALRRTLILLAASGLALPLAPPLHAAGRDGPAARTEAAAPAKRAKRPRVERGQASYYADRFHGRRMANGRRFDRNSSSAAHRHLPLGTKVRVTNLENGRSAVVEIEDRGPYARGRIIDLSPRTAERLGMKHRGVAPVAVTLLQEAEVQQASGD